MHSTNILKLPKAMFLWLLDVLPYCWCQHPGYIKPHWRVPWTPATTVPDKAYLSAHFLFYWYKAHILSFFFPNQQPPLDPAYLLLGSLAYECPLIFRDLKKKKIVLNISDLNSFMKLHSPELKFENIIVIHYLGQRKKWFT